MVAERPSDEHRVAPSTERRRAVNAADAPLLTPLLTTSTSTRSLLKLLHLGSPMLPVGAFSYSQGLEWAVESGAIIDRVSAGTWIFDVLRWSVGRFEAPLLLAAHRGWAAGDEAQIKELNSWMLATRESRELRAETEQLGYSLRRWCADSAAMAGSAWAGPRSTAVAEPVPSSS